MNDTQLYLAIGVPTLLNLTALLLAITTTNARITDLRNAVSTLSSRIDALTGAINELDKRITRVEIKLNIQP
jgi:hypothetical protein